MLGTRNNLGIFAACIAEDSTAAAAVHAGEDVDIQRARKSFPPTQVKHSLDSHPFTTRLLSHLVENHPSPRVLGLVHVSPPEWHSHWVPHGRASPSTRPAPARRRIRRPCSYPRGCSISRCLRFVGIDQKKLAERERSNFDRRSRSCPNVRSVGCARPLTMNGRSLCRALRALSTKS